MTHSTHTQVFTETPLLTKLGVSEDMRIFTINAPDDYIALLGNLPDGVKILTKTQSKVELVHIFATSKDSLPLFLQAAVSHIYSMGAIWVSWPRDDSKTVLTEQNIKTAALQKNLKDEKFTIFSDEWNGIMFRLIS